MRNYLLALVCLCLTVQAGELKKSVIDGVTYHLVSCKSSCVRVVWKDEQQKQMRSFPEVAAYFARQKIELELLMNGGIFEPEGIPSGLLIQQGKELQPVNRNAGEGNFFLQPNGIFLIGSQGAAVMATSEYPPKDPTIHYAVQSGPLLLRNNKVHPVFRAESSSRLHRNGIGVTRKGEIVLAMTDFRSAKFPNLYEFAVMFRGLDCADALFLDGDISQMKTGAAMQQPSNQFGSIIAVSKQESTDKK